jgi:TonB family protein
MPPKPLARYAIFGICLIVLQPCSAISQANQKEDRSAPSEQVAPKGIHPPVPLYRVEAEYPLQARGTRSSGVCAVSLIVDKSGNPQDPTIIRCSDPVFAENSLAAVLKYRFKPATTQSGAPIAVKITVEVNFLFGGNLKDLPSRINYVLRTPPGVTSPAPDGNGVYPLTKDIEAPIVTQFADEGFSRAAWVFSGQSGCDLVFTLNPKGKPSDVQVTHCDRPGLEQPAVSSLLKSHFKPGKLKGKPISVRAAIHITFGGLTSEN